MEPLCFAMLKSLTPPDVETVLHDERLEPIPFDEPTDLVAMTVETYTARRAYQIADEYRRRGRAGRDGRLPPDVSAGRVPRVRRRGGARATPKGVWPQRRRGCAPPAGWRRRYEAPEFAPLDAAASRSQHLRGQALRAGHAGPVRARLPLQLRLLLDPRVLRLERAPAAGARRRARRSSASAATTCSSSTTTSSSTSPKADGAVPTR